MSRENEWFELQRVRDTDKEFVLLLCETTLDHEGAPATEEETLLYCKDEDKQWLITQLRAAANELENLR